MKLFYKILLSIIACLFLVLGGTIFFLTRGLDAGSQQTISQVDLTLLNDGIYSGKYDAGRWSNEVKVTVSNRKITKIDVVKDVMIPKPEATQELFDNVIKNQNTTVDTVAGATVSSKAYLKAIENALKNKN
ncbi:MAG: hypothetical protein K0R31_586 [Clostridiales bacterium]|nr:hypothetical protein [Clostridiales bacterium]